MKVIKIYIFYGAFKRKTNHYIFVRKKKRQD